MITVSWDKKFEIGHERIDFEHRLFFDLIRSVAQEAGSGGNSDRLHRLLKEIRHFAEFHFVSEENIMIDHAYAEYEPHQREHAALLAQLDGRTGDFRAGKISIEYIVEFLFLWFALHTTHEDQKLSSHLTGNFSEATA